jgi:hypothetical protein
MMYGQCAAALVCCAFAGWAGVAGCGGHLNTGVDTASMGLDASGVQDARATPDGPVEREASVVPEAAPSPDAPVIDLGDGGLDAAFADACDLGAVANFATDQTLDIFGQPTYYLGGGPLPPGRYRVSYVDGCMKYSSAQDWTVNAYQGDPDSWWLIGATTSDRILVPPGTVGYFISNGAFATFDECVAANANIAPIEFQFDGGPIGVWLQDNPYTDNVAGTNGRNPKWDLTLLGDCSSVMPR